jgi:hypothetical protein
MNDWMGCFSTDFGSSSLKEFWGFFRQLFIAWI